MHTVSKRFVFTTRFGLVNDFSLKGNLYHSVRKISPNPTVCRSSLYDPYELSSGVGKLSKIVLVLMEE